MSNRKLIKELKEATWIQTRASMGKITKYNNNSFEQGFIKGYISSINYTNAILKKNNIISLEDFLELNEFIAENLDKAKKYE